jgi:hypothetical protein
VIDKARAWIIISVVANVILAIAVALVLTRCAHADELGQPANDRAINNDALVRAGLLLPKVEAFGASKGKTDSSLSVPPVGC